MSGEGPNEQSGFPQDDIDALLNTAGGQEASGASAETPPTSAADPTPTTSASSVVEGGLEPEQFESLAAAASAGSQPDDSGVSSEPSPPADDGGAAAFTQEEIDAAMEQAAGGATDHPPSESAEAGAASAAADPKLDSAGRPFDEAAALMEAAIAEEQAAAAMAAPIAPVADYARPAELPLPPPNAIPLELPDLGGRAALSEEKGIELLNDVDLDVKIELGRAAMLIEDVLKLGEGSVIELDKLAGDPVDVLVNERLVARGEVLILNDCFCVRISEIVAGIGGDDGPNVG